MQSSIVKYCAVQYSTVCGASLFVPWLEGWVENEAGERCHGSQRGTCLIGKLPKVKIP